MEYVAVITIVKDEHGGVYVAATGAGVEGTLRAELFEDGSVGLVVKVTDKGQIEAHSLA